MSNSSQSAGNMNRIEQIVAYLDGELSSDDAAQVENLLSSDPKLSSELASMDRVWEALDVLSEPTVSDRFSQTTMELVVGSASREIAKKTMAIPIRARRQRLALTMVGAASLLLGMVVYGLIWQNPNRRLLEDLPVIQHIDVYSQVPSLQFIENLTTTLGGNPWTSDIDTEELSERTIQHAMLSDQLQRQQWLDKLDNAERVALRARYNRFQALSQDDQHKLRQLHSDLVNHPNREQLESALVQYQLWLSGTPASQQFELRQLEPDDRIREIQRLQQQEEENRIISLSPSELRHVNQVIEPLRKRMESLSSRERLGLIRSMTDEDEDRERLLAEILEVFPPERREAFRSLAPEQQRHSLRRWMMQAVARDSRGGPGDRQCERVSEEELERFFAEDLDASTKERLLAQPRERMEHQLRRMHDRGMFRADQDSPRRSGPSEGRVDHPRGPRNGSPDRDRRGPPRERD